MLVLSSNRKPEVINSHMLHQADSTFQQSMYKKYATVAPEQQESEHCNHIGLSVFLIAH